MMARAPDEIADRSISDRRWLILMRAPANLLVVALAVWLALRSARYGAGSGVPRFQVETAALWFVAVGLTVRIERDRRTQSARSGAPSVRVPDWALPLCWFPR
jgi:hypothetical protein